MQSLPKKAIYKRDSDSIQRTIHIVSYDLEQIKNHLQLQIDLGVTDIFSSAPESVFEKTKTFMIVRSKKKADQALPAPSIPLVKNSILIEQVEKICANVHSLEDLKKAIDAFDGSDLKKMATNLVFCDGNPKSDIMVIGEAPGADEDREGRPFVGMSGKLLDKMLASIGLFREKNIYITNILPYRPPGNRTPTPWEMGIFRPFIIKHIELISPKILILVGATALKTILQKDLPITKIHGNWYDFKAGSQIIKAIPLYHPAYILRSPLQKRTVWQDLLEIQEKINTKE